MKAAQATMLVLVTYICDPYFVGTAEGKVKKILGFIFVFSEKVIYR